VLFVLAPPRGEELLLVDALRRLGARAVEPAGHRVAALFPSPASVDALLWDVERAVRASTTLEDPELAWRWQSHEEWARRWPLEMETRRVTPRLVVTSADPEAADREVVDPEVTDGDATDREAAGRERGVGADDLVIRLDPATAFGTAEHPTTRACLRYLDALVGPGAAILDIGTGSGILAIAAALLGARRVLALESDPMACDAAAGNVARNGVGDAVAVRQLDVTPRTLHRLLERDPRRYDGVVANLETRIVMPLLPVLSGLLGPGGWLVVSGVLEPERHGIVEAGGRAGFELRDEAREGAWWTGSFRAPGAHRTSESVR
jgi:ribosomal protein L11 methylase PrmA